MSYETSSKYRTSEARVETGSGTPGSTGFAFLDMMLQMQKASTQALSSFIPLAPAGAQGGAQGSAQGEVQSGSVRAASARLDQRVEARAEATAQRTSSSVEVIPVGEETLHVGTRTVQGEVTRLRRVVIETPVEQQVSLRTETVVVERRKPASSLATGAVLDEVLSERSIEMSDSFQVAESWKSVHLREEVVLRTEVVERTETVRDVVRRDEVQVEQVAGARAQVVQQAARIEPPKRSQPAEQAVAKRVEQNVEAARPSANTRQQDAAPPVPVKAEADRPSPAPAPSRPAPEANAQAGQHAAPQPDAKPAPAMAAQPEGKPNTSPRPEVIQGDKPSNAPGRRA